MAQPTEIQPRNDDARDRAVSPFEPSNSTKLQFPNDQYNNTKGLPTTPRGDGTISEPFVQYGYHLRAASLSRKDLFGLKPCCGNWEDFIFMSIGQKILQNERYSQYLTRRDRICIENRVIKKATTNPPYKSSNVQPPKFHITPPDPEPGSGTGSGSGSGEVCSQLLVMQARSSPTEILEQVQIELFFPYSSTWKVAVEFAAEYDTTQFAHTKTITGTGHTYLVPYEPDGVKLYSIYQSYTDMATGCEWCFQIIHGTIEAEEVILNLPVPLKVGAGCNTYDLSEGVMSGSGS